MFRSSCSSTSLSRYELDVFTFLSERMFLNVCSLSSLRQFSCGESRTSSREC